MERYINLINRICFYGFLILIASCSKGFLDEDNKTSLSQENYFTSETQAQAAINGIYTKLQSLQFQTAYGEANWIALELPVGHASTLSQSRGTLITHTSSAIELTFQSMWSNFYNGIANANLSISKIPGIEMNEKNKSRLLGEAHFLRAFFYYYLVRLYGDIPLLTEVVTTASPDFYPERSSKEAVYDLIVSDLKTAETSSLPNTDATGRASLGAVKTLLASVYLTMAGQPLNKGAEYYQLAADKAEEVIDNNWYSLFTDYAFLHDRAHKNGQEFIFQVQYLGGIATNSITQLITPEKIGISKSLAEYGSLMPLTQFVESYELDDLRAQEQQFYFSSYDNGTTIREFNRYALYKYWLEEAAGLNGDLNDDANFTLLRLPELMLIYAEASNEVSGPTEKARTQLQIIRDRAMLTTPALSEFNKDSFREFVWRERYHELAFENKAYFDIQRTRKVYNLLLGNFVDAFSYVNESGVTFTEQYMLWPVPQKEIDSNPNLLPQNTGWN